MRTISVSPSAVAVLKNWESGISETNGESVLILQFHSGQEVIVQMAPWQVT